MSDQFTTVSAEVEWREIPGYPGYQASLHGEIRTRWISGGWNGNGRIGQRPAVLGDDWRPVKLRHQKNGYIAVGIVTSVAGGRDKRQVYAHILVCLAFHGPMPQEGMEVAHFPDSNPSNNRPDNLKWATSKENQGHRKIHGTDLAGEKNPHARLTEEIVREIRKLWDDGWSSPRIARKFSINRNTALGIVKRRSWRHVT